jgi:hypothetical protein
MSLRPLVLALVLFGCGGAQSDADEPQTARDKQYAEAKKNGELDDQKPVKKGAWQFKGDRKNCNYLFNSKCFKLEKAACAAAGCDGPACKADGAGPATVSCRKN